MLVDRCIFNASTAGTSNFGVAGAVAGYLTPAQASATDGSSYSYAAQTLDTNGGIDQWEVGHGIASGSATSFTRIVEFSSSANAKVNFLTNPTVTLTALQADIIQTVVNDTNVTGALTSATLTLGWTGQLGLSRGGTHADLSATGGTSQVLRQSTLGGNVSVSQLSYSDISGSISPGTLTLTNTHLFVGNGSNVAADVAMSGDATMANTGAMTLASVISAGGPTGSATVAPIITYDAKGRLTTVSSATITPAVGSITGLGTGVSTALAVNVGTAGSVVVNGGVLGTPISGTAANLTGLPLSTGVTGTLLAASFPALTGDITTSAGALATTLATVNSNVGTFGSATQSSQVTVNGKGLVTAAANVTVTPAVGSITGLGTGVGTALAVNVGSAGAFVTFNGALGTPSSGTLTNATGLPLSTGVTGTLQAAQEPAHTGDVTNSAGSLAMTLATVNSNIGSFGSATASPTYTVNGKGLITAAANVTITPAAGSITGLGTGVATALAVNVGSAGAFVTFNGAGGTPSSMTATNLSGTAASLTAGNVTTNANLTGPITSSGNATSIASQTGTGTKFVVDTSPTLVTPNIGVASGTSLAATGVLSSGANSGTNGQLTLNGSTSGSGVIKVAAAAGSAIVFQIPAANGSSGYVLSTDGAGVTSWTAAAGGGTNNLLFNGQGTISQRNAAVATVTASTAYGPDRWKMLGEDNNGKLTGQDTTVSGAGGLNNIAVTCVTANKKYGICQIIEGLNCVNARSQQVVLSANLSVSNARLGNIKMGIIEWGSTQDTLTAAMVSTWNGDGTTPTLATNYTFKNTPANLSVTTTPTVYSVTATLSSSFNNLVVFIWNDDQTFNANDLIYITNVQLEIATAATTYQQRSIGQEFLLCQRYYQQYNYVNGNTICAGMVNTATTIAGGIAFLVPMRVAPTGALINSSNIVAINAGGGSAGGTGNIAATSTVGGSVAVSGCSGLVAGNASLVFAVGNASYTFTAEQ